VRWKLRIFGGGHDEKEDTVDLEEQKAAARAALARANAGLNAARRRQPEVTRVSTSLREIRRQNHFAEMIQESFKGVT
jgi:hypothetical protein